MVKQLVLGYNLVQKQLKNQNSFEKKDGAETESKSLDASLCNIFGFGAEITRLSLVKIVQVSSRMGQDDQKQADFHSYFITYLQVVSRAVSLLYKSNCFSEAALIIERCEDLRKSIP